MFATMHPRSSFTPPIEKALAPVWRSESTNTGADTIASYREQVQARRVALGQILSIEGRYV
ncbi:hypothetical protein [Microbacterium sp. A94]|uniref:hypothetical protein n=1 Tax=Microbacterium sp. A94 TaxID=3450717 RepID=UPI003F43242E